MKTICLILLVAFTACHDSKTPVKDPCPAHGTCASCLAEKGCNWTGGRCSDVCLMDTDCYGPGNKSAPTCPEVKKPAGDEVAAALVELVPGKSLGQVSLGMSREDLEKIFPGKLVVQYEEAKTGEAYLKAGPYGVTLMDGKVDSAGISLFAAKRVRLNDSELKSGLTLEQAAKILPKCEVEHRRGATLYHCSGCGLSCPGNNIPDTLEVWVSHLKPEPKAK